MNSDPGQTSKRRIWPGLLAVLVPLVITLLVAFVPDVRRMFAHILAALCALIVTPMVLLGAGKHRPH